MGRRLNESISCSAITISQHVPNLSPPINCNLKCTHRRSRRPEETVSNAEQRQRAKNQSKTNNKIENSHQTVEKYAMKSVSRKSRQILRRGVAAHKYLRTSISYVSFAENEFFDGPNHINTHFEASIEATFNTYPPHTHTVLGHQLAKHCRGASTKTLEFLVHWLVEGATMAAMAPAFIWHTVLQQYTS